jgi:hypothetical protein
MLSPASQARSDGTGKDVSDEDINDAKPPLQIKWHNGSYLKIPARK